MSGLTNFSNFVSELQDKKFKKLDSEGNIIEVGFILNSPADNDDLNSVEQDLGKLLPKSYKKFLLKYNGARIFDYEGLDGFVILGTNDIISSNKFVSDTFEEDWKDSLVIFAKYIGEGNFIAFDCSTDDYSVIDCFVEELPEKWNTIACDFDEFLDEMIKNQGRKYWL